MFNRPSGSVRFELRAPAPPAGRPIPHAGNARVTYVSFKAEGGDHVGQQLTAVPLNQVSAWGKYRLAALGAHEFAPGDANHHSCSQHMLRQ